MGDVVEGDEGGAGGTEAEAGEAAIARGSLGLAGDAERLEGVLDERTVGDDDDAALGLRLGLGPIWWVGRAHAGDGAAAAVEDGGNRLATDFRGIDVGDGGEVGEEAAFEGALAALAEVGVEPDGEAGVARDGGGGLGGAGEVAGVEGVPGLGGESAGGGFGLAETELGEGRVLLALDAALEVPGALAVADEAEERLDLGAHTEEGRYCTPEGRREMLGITFTGGGGLVVGDFAEDEPGVGEVKIETAVSGICGTDLHTFGRPGQPATKPPGVIAGHEICGTVTDVGEGAPFRLGERVVANHIVGCGVCGYCRQGAPHFCATRRRAGRDFNGSMGQRVVIAARNVFRLHDDLTWVDGVFMACNFGTAFSAVRRAGVSGEDSVAVFGLGPVGLCVAVTAKAMGARVIGVELSAERRALAERVVRCEVVDPAAGSAAEAVLALTGGVGVDVALDATGVGAAQNAAIDATRPMGTMVFIGVGGETTISPFRQLIAKDLNVFGSYTYKLGETDDMTRFLLRHRLNFGAIVGRTCGPREAESAFADALSASMGKVLFDWAGV